MDKAEYISKLEQINSLAEAGDFRGASDVADEIDWRHVKSVRTLSMIGEIYEANHRYEESLRVMKKGGVFALHDDMKPNLYGDMEAFAQKLRDMGYSEVELVDTRETIFGSEAKANAVMLGGSRLLRGRK